MRGTILHFSVELGSRSIGGVGTCIDELRRVRDPDVGYVCLVSAPPTEPAMDADVVYAGFYDMDILNRLEFDVAVFHYYGLAYLADASFLKGRPLAFVVHSVPTTEPWSLLDPYGGNLGIARAFERLCDAAEWIVCVSDAERGKLLLMYPDLERKTVTLRNGSSAFEDVPLRLDADRNTFGFLGRADERKGLRELVRAFAEVDGRLRIACGDEDPELLRAVRDDIERLGLQDRVSWLGRVTGDADKAAFLRSLDALVVPSRWEPFGYVALEALRAGVPPLVGRQGGMLEIVGPDYPYAFDPTRPDEIAACIRRFQRDPVDVVREAVQRARHYAAPLTAERMAAAYKRLLREVRHAPLPADPPPRGRRFGREDAPIPPALGSASATPKPVRPPFPKEVRT
ncbi:glycosyltransferase family 4 protein [Paenibacillus sp.]|uniref:glycosyltransferase family 4 protein n=1 Tax=Paenibacillus sp. TaxID=58172 RepID=UPI002811B227|nr:glycosyltransferase family 4 protein [Paenibacillus sp.]